jgi:hypothetical protein
MRACVFLNSLKCSRLNFFQRARLRRRRAEKLKNLLHAQSVLSVLDSYNFGAGFDYGKIQAESTEACSIVATKKSMLSAYECCAHDRQEEL